MGGRAGRCDARCVCPCVRPCVCVRCVCVRESSVEARRDAR